MPIVNLTNREAAFPQIGILRKGAPKPKSGPGKDLKHFRFTSEHGDVLASFHAHYGDAPTDINVFLPYRTTDENFSAWREHWVAGGLVHRCDGETCTIWRNKEGGYSTEKKPCPEKDKASNKRLCKPVGRLSVIVPELKRLAYVTTLTTSLHDIMTLTENLQALEMFNGDLRGIPLVLRRRPRKVSTPRGTKRVRSEKWLLTLEAAPQWVALQLAAQQATAVPRLEDGSLPQLMAPEDDNGVTIDADTGEIIDTVGVPTAEKQGNSPDYDDAPPEWFDDAPPEQPEPRPNGDGHSRPLDAETVKATIRKKAGWQGDSRLDSEPITDGQKGAVAGLISDALGSMDSDVKTQARHELLNYLVGVTSSSKLTKREASAIITWLKADGDEWIINQWAVAEVAAVLNASAVEAGQMELEM